MNFFGLFGTSAPEDENEDENQQNEESKDENTNTSVTQSVDPSKLGRLGSDKIFSNFDPETGKVKTSHYNPPNLFLGMSVGGQNRSKKVVFEDEKKQDKIEEQEPVEQQLKSLYEQNDAQKLQVKQHSAKEKSNTLFGVSASSPTLLSCPISQSTIIPNYMLYKEE
jgi:hypothetical protein